MTMALYVFLGGGLGSLARWLVGLGAIRLLGAGFPYGTLTVNILGSFVIGVLARVLPPAAAGGQEARLLLMTGFLGGFTTFSAFALDTAGLVGEGEGGRALLYVLASVLLSFAAVAAGLAVGAALRGAS
ncbi:MAG: fluoride efflux transporter CrcB [Hyphomicrobiales bacterium]|nr:fluoride efflux transporter CrcB [Hyphomicrobiales bacterium]